MVKKSIDVKVRPLANNTGLEKASLAGAARVYVTKDALLSLSNGLESRPCILDKIPGDGGEPPLPKREALLCANPQGMSAHVVLMTRAFLEASGFKLGDQLSICLTAAASVPDADEVVVEDVSDEDDKSSLGTKYAPCWEHSLSISMNRAEIVFPGMVFEGVNINKFRRNYKVLTVNAQTNNVAKFKLSSTALRISSLPAEEEVDEAALPAGELTVTGIPGLAAQISTLNSFLRGFTRPFLLPDERSSCGLVIHGGPGTGKTLILKRLEATRWGKTYWVEPTDKMSTMRETFKLARASAPSIIFIDGLEKITGKDRSNRESVIDILAKELGSLSAEIQSTQALPQVVVIATCRDYMLEVPEDLQRRPYFRTNIALPIPRASERLEILRFYNPAIRPEEKEACLVGISQKTHAYSGDDLVNLIEDAAKCLRRRLDDMELADDAKQEHLLTTIDMEAALRITRPTAMHDINLKPPTIHWKDVGGQEPLKRVLQRMIKKTKGTQPAALPVLRHPPKGLLLYGPPGCSKTLSAQAMATESGFNFFAVKGAELLNMYVGESERAVRTLFERARAASPSIIFFDEIDSIGGQRGGGPGGASAASRSTGAVNMLTTLLTEMDGFEALTGVLVLAATNRPEAIDPALIRPGRFDQVVYVGPPDGVAREAVFTVHLRGLAVADDIDIPELARRADGYSGAEIKAIINEAGLAVEERYDDDETGTARFELAMDDLIAAMDKTPRRITREMVESYEDWHLQFTSRLK
ncbi:hypothetical protein RJ55_06553 [Drechmeria coniospora]|nr:hypothetical protein RJ55_06553 [Drechmeria coniospora]